MAYYDNMKTTKADVDDPAFEGIIFNGPPYVCKCGYVTKKMSTFKSHIKRQTPCEKQKQSEFVCECYEEYNTAVALEKHKKNCIVLKRKDIYNKKNIAITNGNNNIINNGNNNINNTTGTNDYPSGEQKIRVNEVKRPIFSRERLHR